MIFSSRRTLPPVWGFVLCGEDLEDWLHVFYDVLEHPQSRQYMCVSVVMSLILASASLAVIASDALRHTCMLPSNEGERRIC